MGIPFKLYEGKEANLPAELTAGGIYFCEDSGNVFIDVDIDGTLTRVPLGKKYVDDQLKDIKEFIENQGSGIEIGSEPPTKESANVWIDTDDEDEEGVEYLGVVTSINGKGGDINITASDIDAAEKTHAAQHASGGSDPITPAAIGALSKGECSNIDTHDEDGIFNTLSTAGGTFPPSARNTVGVLIHKKWDFNFKGQIFVSHGSAGMFYRVMRGGVWEAWQTLATTDYALPRDGSAAMTGTLRVNSDAIITGGLEVGEFVDFHTPLEPIDTHDYSARLTLDRNSKEPYWVKAEVGTYNILHTGNKPSGSYTGNGSATERSIAMVGAIGHAVLVWSNNGAIIITRVGGFGTKVLDYGACHFEGDYTKIATTDSLLNASGDTYHYQVL